MQSERVQEHVKELLQEANNMLKNNPKSALDLLSQAITEADEIDFVVGRAEAIRLQGLSHLAWGKHTPALIHFNTALQLYLALDDEQGIAKCRSNIGYVNFIQNKHQVAIEQIQKSLTTFHHLDMPDEIASCYKYLAEISHKEKDYQQELKFLFEGMSYINRCQDQSILQAYLLDLGIAYIAIGEDEQSLVYLLLVLKDEENWNNQSCYALSLILISSIYERNGEAQKAISSALEALNIAEQHDDKILVANCMKALASAYQISHNYQQSLNYAEKALAIFHQLQDRINEIACMIQVASLVQQLGDAEESENILRIANSLAREIDDKKAQIRILYELAVHLNHKFKFLESIKYLESAFSLMKENPAPEILPSLYQIWADNYQQQRDFEKSLLYFKKYHELTLGKTETESREIHLEKSQQVPVQKSELHPINQVTIQHTTPKSNPKPDILESSRKLAEIANGLQLYNEQGELIRFDTPSENKQSDNGMSLNGNASKLQTIIDALPDITFIFDFNGNYLDVMLSHAREDYNIIMSLKGKNIRDLCSEEETARYLKVIHDTIQTGKMQTFEYQFDPVIEQKWYEGRTALLNDYKTGEANVIWVARDITLLKEINQDLSKLNIELESRINERTTDLKRIKLELEHELDLHKNAAKLLQQRCAEQTALFSVIPAIVYYKDRDLKYITANQAFCDIFQLEPNQVNGLTDFDLFPADIAQIIIEEDRKVIEGINPPSESIKKLPIKNGDLRWFSTTETFYRDELGEIIALVGVSSDVTELKRQEEELSRLFTAIEQSAGTVCITDAKGLIRYVNPAFLSITGYSSEEVLGKNPKFLRSGKHDVAFYTEMWNKINSGQVWKGVFTNQRKDGMIYEEEAIISPVKDESGNVISFVKVSRDVTRENMLMLQLRHSQKMEAIGTLAGGIAHDFNNILGAIMGYSELIADDLPPSSVAARDMKQVMTAVERAKELVNQILTFSKMSETECKSLHVQTIIKDVTKLLRASLLSTIEIKENINEETLSTYADPSQINQILMNLCTNAASAMQEKGGTLTIGLENANMSERFFVDRDIPNGSYLKLTVSDTGIGIPKALLERIFDPFFTTKAPGLGTGLGLSVVHGIISGYGGKIFVESTEGIGTTFTILLKAEQKAVTPIETKHVDLKLPKGKEHILVVDDEAFIIDIMKQTLTRLGYVVTAVTESQTALALITSNTKKYDLLITDLTMPGMTGLDLALSVKKVQPDLPIVLCSGLNELIDTEVTHKTGIQKILKKPIDRRKLAEVTRSILDEVNQASALKQVD